MLFNKLTTDQKKGPARARLSDLLGNMPVVQVVGPVEADVNGITTDSRKVTDHSLFVACPGERTDGHAFVQKAVENGASVVVIGARQYGESLRHLLTPAWIQHNGTTVVVVRDTRIAVAELAARFFGAPASKLRLVGITGTNGKTTTSYLMASVLESAGEKCGTIGTISYRIGDEETPADFTTPPAEQLHRVLAEMRHAGCKAVVMEVSSHALALRRVHGLSFDASIFTNLSRDHLDFHRTMTAYRKAKELLFRDHTRRCGVLNRDDKAWTGMAAVLGRKTVTYGVDPDSSFRILNTESGRDGIRFVVKRMKREYRVESDLTGAFNCWNLAAAFSTGVKLRIDPDLILKGMQNVRSVPGRFEKLMSSDGVLAVVDYSHTPDALGRAISAARFITGSCSRVITVFGCGGDRDQGKRPMMGAAATRLSDLTIVTSDNPRGEDPDAIIDAILRGAAPGAEVRRNADRRRAILSALRVARPGDLVLIAGKGHERYQIRKGKKVEFDDREVVRNYFTAKRGGVKP